LACDQPLLMADFLESFNHRTLNSPLQGSSGMLVI
jgi:hypothetical protein